MKFVKWSIQTLWERSGKDSMGKKNVRPSGVVFIDANVLPHQILPHLGKELSDKIFFAYTGEKAMEHMEEIEIIEEMLEDSLKLYEYKPVMLALGCETMLSKVTRPQLSEISDYLAKPGDKRRGQVIHSYAELFKACLVAIREFGLDPPPSFATGDLDCTSLTYFNNPKQVKNKKMVHLVSLPDFFTTEFQSCSYWLLRPFLRRRQNNDVPVRKWLLIKVIFNIISNVGTMCLSVLQNPKLQNGQE